MEKKKKQWHGEGETAGSRREKNKKTIYGPEEQWKTGRRRKWKTTWREKEEKLETRVGRDPNIIWNSYPALYFCQAGAPDNLEQQARASGERERERAFWNGEQQYNLFWFRSFCKPHIGSGSPWGLSLTEVCCLSPFFVISKLLYVLHKERLVAR